MSTVSTISLKACARCGGHRPAKSKAPKPPWLRAQPSCPAARWYSGIESMTQEMIAVCPLPEVTRLTAPFWDAVRNRRLVLQRCGSCARCRFPPEVACPHCGSPPAEWAPVRGCATLYTWTVAHPPLLPYFQKRSPWLIAAVELE